MTNDERTLILLAAEALRTDRIAADLHGLLADALDRIAGKGEEPRVAVKEGNIFAVIEPRDTTTLDPRFGPNTAGASEERFTPNSGKCWRCGKAPDTATMCYPCWDDCAARGLRGHCDDARLRAWIEAEERGKP